MSRIWSVPMSKYMTWNETSVLMSDPRLLSHFTLFSIAGAVQISDSLLGPKKKASQKCTHGSLIFWVINPLMLQTSCSFGTSEIQWKCKFPHNILPPPSPSMMLMKVTLPHWQPCSLTCIINSLWAIWLKNFTRLSDRFIPLNQPLVTHNNFAPPRPYYQL